MNRLKFLSLALIVLVGCSKSSDPAATPTAGCSVKLKGTTYALSTAACTTNGAEQYLAASNAGTATSPAVSLGKGVAVVGDYITFFTNSSDPNTLYTSIGALTAPSITISGKTWTFTAAVFNSNDPTDIGTIEGTCTCN
jgi:hypothetical protein